MEGVDGAANEPLRRVGGRGGSDQTVPGRRKTPSVKSSDIDRALARLGEEYVRELQATWKSMATQYGEKDHDKGDGLVLALVKQNVPDAQVRAIFGIGGPRLNRVKEKGIKQPRPPPSHAISQERLDFIKIDAQSWELEDGFPCQHRRPQQYFVEPKITWKKIWERYTQAWRRFEWVDSREKENPISYSRYLQYAHFFFPGVRLSRTSEDACDACVRIEIALKNPNLSEDEIKELQEEKALHLDAAINQRRAMTGFVKRYAAQNAPQQTLPDEIVVADPTTNISDDPIQHNQPPTLQIQIEDFGGSFSLPFYGCVRPSADYFNSDLSIHNFIIADITNNINNVILYDERGQGKGADALCSLRLSYHLELRKRNLAQGIAAPEKTVTLLMILDNCVGQNKSKQVFNFFAMLSLLFYKKVVVLYLLPGHSHNAADRVVAWCKNKMRGENIYSPLDAADRMNGIKSVRAQFLDHNSATRPFFCGWSVPLEKYFGGMPANYTSNYFFEIDLGVVSIRHLVSSPDEEVDPISLIGRGDASAIRQAFIEDLFGAKSLDLATMDDVLLERQPVLTLSDKKVKSLANKYSSIPANYLPYFPTAKDATINSVSTTNTTLSRKPDGVDQQSAKRVKKAAGVEKATRPIGRPRKNAPTSSPHPSILNHFKPAKLSV